MDSRRRSARWIAIIMAMLMPSTTSFVFDGSAGGGRWRWRADAFAAAPPPAVRAIVPARARRSPFATTAAFPDGKIARSAELFAAEGEPEDEPAISEEEEGANDEAAAAPHPPPPPLLAPGYALAACANAVAGLLLLRNVPNIAAAGGEAAAMVSTRHPNLLATYVAGSLGHLFLAAGTCGVLSRSATTNRLRTSNTYKRLTAGTLIFGVLGLCSLPGEAGCLLPLSSSSPSSALLPAGVGALLATQLAKFLTAFASFVGWEHGAGGFGTGVGSWRRLKNMLREVGRGCRRAWRTMPVTDDRPATFYRTFLIFVCLGSLIFNGPELVFNVRQGGLFSLPASLTVSSVARLGLLAVLLYTLKDAAERKRLEGTTFVSINTMVGLWAFGVGIAQGLADGPAQPFNIRRAADKFLFAVPFLNNGILGCLTKMGVIERRDEEDPDADPPFRVPLF